MHSTAVVIIGAGQAGLAMSRRLTDGSIDHVVLERGEVANSWRHRALGLAPSPHAELDDAGCPGHRYRGADPDGFMTRLRGRRRSSTATAARIGAPVATGTPRCRRVRSRPTARLHVVATDRGAIWRCRAVVVATGACSTPQIPPSPPSCRRTIRSSRRSTTATRAARRRAGARGRRVGVGRSRSPTSSPRRPGGDARRRRRTSGCRARTAAGTSTGGWTRIGQLDERYDEVDDIDRARRLPSLQLVGSPEHRTLDLNALAERRRRAGRPAGRHVTAAGPLLGLARHTCADADLKMGRLLDQIDEFARDHGLGADLADAHRPRPTLVRAPRTTATLSDYSTVIWATGYKPGLPVARPETPRPQRSDHSRRRRDAPARAVRARPSVHAPPQIELPRRCRSRCSISRQSPRRPSSRQSAPRNWSDSTAPCDPPGTSPGLSSANRITGTRHVFRMAMYHEGHPDKYYEPALPSAEVLPSPNVG